MSRINSMRSVVSGSTHEGAPARKLAPLQELRRSVLSCMLWENEFYESGDSNAKRIAKLVPEVDPLAVASLAAEARSDMHLRHVPLFLVREMARYPEHKKLVRQTLGTVIQRADELTEFLAIYWKDKRQPLAKSVQRGLADAFSKFSAYQLAKYNLDAPIKLRDVLFLSHAKPANAERELLYNQLVNGTLPTPDTWEVELSKSSDKTASWTRLLREGKLGAMALIRNLRNMTEAKVDAQLVRDALRNAKPDRVLPFRFVAAAQHAPKFEEELNDLMLRCCQQLPRLQGETVLVVDVSGSMYCGAISAKSDLNRAYAACALGALARETCEHADVFATGGNDRLRKHATARVPARRGLSLVDAIFKMKDPLGGGGIFLTQCLDWVWAERGEKQADRVIVITDEQDCETNSAKSPLHARQIAKRQYLINVASYKPGIGYGAWHHIDGWSERVLDYIRAVEQESEYAG